MKIMKILGIDFETANNKTPSPCSIGLTKKELFSSEGVERRGTMINPETWFSTGNMAVHGITAGMVKDAPTFPEALRIFEAMILDDPLVLAHNAPFDIPVMAGACRRYGIRMPGFRYMDTLALCRKMTPRDMPHGLAEMAEHFKLPKFRHHTASDDAETCVLLFEALMRKGGFGTPEEMSKATGVGIRST